MKCVVLDVDAPRGRVSLSLRQTRPDPLKQSLASILVSPDGSTTVRSPCIRLRYLVMHNISQTAVWD